MKDMNFKTAFLGTLTLLAAMPAFAVTESYDVVTRMKNGSFEITSEAIEGLVAPGQFETDHFRVSWKKEDTALTVARIRELVALRITTEKENPLWVDRDENTLLLMAANALYHAEKARKFFVESIGSEEVAKQEKIVLRLDLTNRSSDQAHFMNDNKEPQYNNALSVAGGKPFKPESGIQPWGREIWFRPKKEIPIGELLAKLPEDPTNPAIRQARQALYPMQIDAAFRTVLYATYNSTLESPGFIKDMTRQAGTLLLMEGAFQVLKLVNRVLIPSHFYLDSALVPEIIYHEFSHLALSEWMKPDLSTPVNEGMADYFAASIANSPKLAKKIKAYSTATSKNGKKRQQFQIELESTEKAQASFALSVLWGLREVLGPKTARKVIFEARKSLRTYDSNLRDGLPRAILTACAKHCESPMRDQMLILQDFQKSGL